MIISIKYLQETAVKIEFALFVDTVMGADLNLYITYLTSEAMRNTPELIN